MYEYKILCITIVFKNGNVGGITCLCRYAMICFMHLVVKWSTLPSLWRTKDFSEIWGVPWRGHWGGCSKKQKSLGQKGPQKIFGPLEGRWFVEDEADIARVFFFHLLLKTFLRGKKYFLATTRLLTFNFFKDFGNFKIFSLRGKLLTKKYKIIWQKYFQSFVPFQN